MLVSVVTSVYNCEKYIEEMIESILAQSLQDWECILYDDASTDNTWNIIQQYSDPRIIAIRNEKNKGLTYNLNRGIVRARGKYIIRIDGDDVAYSSRFQKQVAFMEEHPEIALSGCSMKCFGRSHNVLRVNTSDEFLRINLMFNSVVMHPAFIIRKEFLDRHEIRYNESLRYAQDYNLQYQIIQYGRIANIPEVLMKYRIHEKQVSIEKSRKQQECADITRDLMLNLLEVRLDKEEKECWFRYCVDDFRIVSENEKKMILDIQGAIVRQNEQKELFDSRLLKECLERKAYRLFEEHDDMSAAAMSEKHLSLFRMMNQWVKIKQEGKSLEKYLGDKGYLEIVIYGMGDVGKTLLTELKDSGIKVVYAIDRDLEGMNGKTEVRTTVDPSRHADVIVVTAITCFEEIKEQLKRNVDCPILSLEDVLYDM